MRKISSKTLAFKATYLCFQSMNQKTCRGATALFNNVEEMNKLTGLKGATEAETLGVHIPEIYHFLDTYKNTIDGSWQVTHSGV